MTGTEYEGRTFDRVLRQDAKSQNYPVAGLLSLISGDVKLPDRAVHQRRVWLDQGAEGACTGFGFGHFYSMAPKVNADVVDANAEYWYKMAQRNDEWDGESYDGSSVLGVMKAAKSDGYISEYRWATSGTDILVALTKSAVVLGIPWYASMMEPEGDTVSVNGAVVGGHCLAAGAYRSTGEKIEVRLDNSWGRTGWGVDGSAWIDLTDLKRLLGEGGECAVPVKASKPPKLKVWDPTLPEIANVPQEEEGAVVKRA